MNKTAEPGIVGLSGLFFGGRRYTRRPANSNVGLGGNNGGREILFPAVVTHTEAGNLKCRPWFQ